MRSLAHDVRGRSPAFTPQPRSAMRTRRPVLLASALVVLAGATPAPAQIAPRTATFAEYASPVTAEYQATPGRPVTSGGLDFYAAFGAASRNALATWGFDPSRDPIRAPNRPSNVGASVAMFDDQVGDEIDILAHGASLFDPRVLFDLYSIDVAHLFSTRNVPVLEPFTLTFTGYRGPGYVLPPITQTFTVAAPPLVGGLQTPLLQTLLFDQRWTGLSNVYWFQTSTALSQAHQFTNVRAAVLPEPGAVLLVATGLLGLGAAARRRHPG